MSAPVENSNILVSGNPPVESNSNANPFLGNIKQEGSDSSKNLDIESGNGDQNFEVNQLLRMGFISKVYVILSMQLIFTTIMCTMVTLIPSVRRFFQQNIWPLIVNLVLSVILISLQKRSSKKSPLLFYSWCLDFL